mmetsp:Transcript_59152/g.105138  ORF Transcript_59152/g.105138 Transcript_59152/m.105138 type:complete len:281 (-) Transcript_59152:61-903(-)
MNSNENMAEETVSRFSQDAPIVHRTSFLRRRPVHPDRFLAFARRRFGPLNKDLQPDSQLPPSSRGEWESRSSNVPVLVQEAGGCVWFIGSDDVAAEWRFTAGQQHLIRCGDSWEDDVHGTYTAGHRRVELVFQLANNVDRDVLRAWEQELLEELSACLLSRAEAEAFENGMLEQYGSTEWEEIRAAHEHISPWVGRWWLMLTVLHTLTSFVSSLPGVSSLSALGKAITSRVSPEAKEGEARVDPYQPGAAGSSKEDQVPGFAILQQRPLSSSRDGWSNDQ